MNAIDYPTITVGERTLIVRFSLVAQILMRRRGMDPGKLDVLTSPANPEARENWLKLFACMVDENFESQAKPEAYVAGNGPSGDYWATQIDPDEFGDMCAVCNESMGKVAESLRKRRAAAPIPIAS